MGPFFKEDAFCPLTDPRTKEDRGLERAGVQEGCDLGGVMSLRVLLRGPCPLRQRLAWSWAQALPGPLLWLGSPPPGPLRTGDRQLGSPVSPRALQQALAGEARRFGTVVVDGVEDLGFRWLRQPGVHSRPLTAPLLAMAAPATPAPQGFDLVADLDTDEVLVVSQARHPSLRGLVIRQPGPELLVFLPGGFGLPQPLPVAA